MVALDRGANAGLLREARLDPRVGEQLITNELEGALGPRGLLLHEVQHTHPALTQRANDSVLPSEHLTRLQRYECHDAH